MILNRRVDTVRGRLRPETYVDFAAIPRSPTAACARGVPPARRLERPLGVNLAHHVGWRVAGAQPARSPCGTAGLHRLRETWRQVRQSVLVAAPKSLRLVSRPRVLDDRSCRIDVDRTRCARSHRDDPPTVVIEICRRPPKGNGFQRPSPSLIPRRYPAPLISPQSGRKIPAGERSPARTAPGPQRTKNNAQRGPHDAPGHRRNLSSRPAAARLRNYASAPLPPVRHRGLTHHPALPDLRPAAVAVAAPLTLTGSRLRRRRRLHVAHPDHEAARAA